MTVTITGTYVNVTGTPLTGRGFIEPSTQVLNAAAPGGPAYLGGLPFVLDAAGTFSVVVPATDDPNLTPTGFTYRLGLYLTTGTPTRLPDVFFLAPQSAGTIDVTDLVTLGEPIEPGEFIQLDARLDLLEGAAGMATFTRAGTLAPVAGAARLYNDTGAARTLLAVRAAVGTSPGGAPVVADLLLDGSSVFPTTPRPSVAAGAFTGSAVPDVTAWPAGSYLTASVVSVGSSPAGADLTLTATYR